jgi:hypothetical protein
LIENQRPFFGERLVYGVYLYVVRKLMKIFLLIIISFLTAVSMNGQSLNDLNVVLSKGTVSALDDYIVMTDSRRLKMSQWRALREIAPGYSEGIAVISFYVPPFRRDSLGNNYLTYKLSILSHGDSILYYSVEERVMMRQQAKIKVTYEPVLSLGSKNIAELDSSFYKTFHVALNKRELFVDTIIYGDYCGEVLTPTPERRMINLFVEENNDKELLSWLTSTNTEKEVYAVDGLLQLKKKAYKIDDPTWALIKYIIAKKGTIQTCDGCIGGANKIRNVIKL